MELTKIHEWELARLHGKALQAEDYGTCQEIQDEVNGRISSGTINDGLMEGFRYYNPKTKRFEGDVITNGLNGLFSHYKYTDNK